MSGLARRAGNFLVSTSLASHMPHRSTVADAGLSRLKKYTNIVMSVYTNGDAVIGDLLE
jgi:hypothetical protein